MDKRTRRQDKKEKRTGGRKGGQEDDHKKTRHVYRRVPQDVEEAPEGVNLVDRVRRERSPLRR